MVELLLDTDRQIKKVAESNLRMLFDTNPVAQWASERLILAPGIETQVGVKRIITISELDDMGRRESRQQFENSATWLYPNYAEWCENEGRKDLGGRNFTKALENVLCQQLKLDGVERLANSNSKGSRFLGVRTCSHDDEHIHTLSSLKYGKEDRKDKEVCNKVRFQSGCKPRKY
jgi:hypothetical protein